MQTKIYCIATKTNREGSAPLRIIIHHLGHRYEIASLEKVKAENWQHQKQRVGRKEPHANFINTQLQQKKLFLETSIYQQQAKGTLPKQQQLQILFKEKFVPGFTAPIAADPKSLQQFTAHYISKYEHQKSKEYLRGFQQVTNHLLQFRTNLQLKDITLKFLASYIDYLIHHSLSNNTIQNHVKKIRQLCKEAAKEGIIITKDYEDFKYKGESQVPFWLTWEEVESLQNYQCATTSDQQILDEFLFRCYTGIRQSDAAALTKENYSTEQSNHYLTFTSQKTRKQQKIILPAAALQILANYAYTIPQFSQQQLNSQIKKIAQAAGIQGQHKLNQQIGSHRITTVKQRNQLITTHTARRTFARHWADQKGDIIKLSKYLGHSSPAITMQYIGYEGAEIDQELLKVFEG